LKHLLEVDSVIKRYDNQLVVSDVYIKCETGNIIGLLGRNGSGKSTLFKIISGIINADAKFIRIDGVVKHNTNRLIGEISYLPQHNFIPDSFTVKKAIDLSIEKLQRNDFYNDEMIKTILKNKISQLSGGELRYLEIKLILNNSSKFVLLDEPYNGLAPIIIEKINKLIIDNSKSRGIIITDHNYANVLNVSTQLILMKFGKTYHLTDKNQLIEKGYLRAGMI
jgi:ABC-type lipopolysaccharide export system ATPase subunit